jgi:DNA-binding Lrp family transcriptional regulator
MSITKNNGKTTQRVKIFILISCVDGKIDSAFEKISKINSFSQIQKTDGAYDLIITLEADSNEELKRTLMHEIRSIDDVKYTLTLRSSLDDEVLG